MQPLAPGETSLGVSLGGPLINTLGAVFPTPMLNVGGARGVSERVAVTGAVNLTAALYGTVHLEPGVVFFPVRQRHKEAHRGVPSVGLSGSFHFLANGKDLLLAPHLGGVAAWTLATGLLGYAGLDAAYAFAPTTDRDARLVAGPLLGAEFARGRARYGLECKWLAPWYDVEPAAPAWISPGRHGYLSVVLGFGYHFGGTP